MKIVPHFKDYWSICKMARSYAMKYLSENFVPLKLDYKDIDSKITESKVSKKNYTLFDRELKLKQSEIRKQVGVYVIKEALDVWTKNKYRGSFLHKYMGMDGDPDEKFDYCLSEAKENCENWNTEKLNNNEIVFTKIDEEQKSQIEISKVGEDNDEEETGFIPDEEDIDENRMKYMKILNDFMKEENYSHNMILKGKIISLVDSIKYNKGIVITGPRCSGKTSIIKGLGFLLNSSDINIEMRISILNPDVYDIEKLYGTADSGVMNPEISTNQEVKISSISSNVLEIALKGFHLLTQKEDEKEEEKSEIDLEVEKSIQVSNKESESENSEVEIKLLKILLFESSTINPLWSDCLVEYMKKSNYTTNILSSCTENDLERHKLDNNIPLTFPNGASIKLPRDILMMFE